MKVYVAARWEDKAEAAAVANALASEGHEIVSSWLEEPDDNKTALDAAGKAMVAQRDLREIAGCQVIVILSYPHMHRDTTGGKHVELGAALVLGKAIVLVGARENIFHYHPSVRVAPNVAALLGLLRPSQGLQEGPQ